MIWNYKQKEIQQGYSENDRSYQCILCDEEYEKGRIYQEKEALYDAFGAVKLHVQKEHGSVAEYLLHQALSLTGLTEIQRKLLLMILKGKSDQEIGQELGIAQSTVRNHRFKIREREKQAKLFLALMASLEEETKKPIQSSDTGIIEEVHRSARMVDDRFNITDKEREKTLATYMTAEGAIKQFPSKEKKKIILLSEVIKNFKPDTEYAEHEVNRVLKRIYEEDYPTLRRALIEYGFMDRSDDCSVYRVKE